MKNILSKLRRDENGAALVEYALLVGFIAAACVAGVTMLGTQLSSSFANFATIIPAV